MLRSVLVNGDSEEREHVKDSFGSWFCEGMYVNEAIPSGNRQGWVIKVIDENDGLGKIQVKVVWDGKKFLDDSSFYTTDLEPSTNWCKALVDG